MKNVPKYILVMAGILAGVALLGGGLLYWQDSEIETKTQQRDALIGQISSVDKKGIFPSSANLKTLQENRKRIDAVLEGIRPLIEKNRELFSEVRQPTADGKGFQGLEPDAWKRLLSKKSETLNKLAGENAVKLPENYEYAFRTFHQNNPPKEQTLDLGVQLLGVEQLGRILFESKIRSLTAIKRVALDGRKGPGGGDEYVPAENLPGPNNLYKVYPFELDFASDSGAFTQVINRLTASDFLFVIRNVSVENEKNTVPTRSQVRGGAPADAAGFSADGTVATQKLLTQILGQELINVRLRVDLIYWQPPVSGEKK